MDRVVRYTLIREAADRALSHAERGRAVRSLAGDSIPDPMGWRYG